VLIDYRAGSKELLKYPPFDECGELCEIKSAKGEAAGDVMFYGNGAQGRVSVGVELKSIDDLMSSSSNGRLQGTQLPVMLDEYDVVWLLYYGDVRPAPGSCALQIWRKGQWRNHYVGNRQVPYSYFSGFIISLQEVGINVAHARDISEAAAWLAELVRWRTKPWHKHKSLRQFDRSRRVTNGVVNGKQANRAALMPVLDERTQLRAQTALALPTLGMERALAAAERWSVREMANAGVEEWAELATVDRGTGKRKRLGKVSAEAVVRALNW
jgi:ERCC4-type nuclease